MQITIDTEDVEPRPTMYPIPPDKEVYLIMVEDLEIDGIELEKQYRWLLDVVYTPLIKAGSVPIELEGLINLLEALTLWIAEEMDADWERRSICHTE